MATAVAAGETSVTGGAQMKPRVKVPGASGSISNTADSHLAARPAICDAICCKISCEARFKIFIPRFQIFEASKYSAPAEILEAGLKICYRPLGIVSGTEILEAGSNSRGSPLHIQTGVPIQTKKQLVPARHLIVIWNFGCSGKATS